MTRILLFKVFPFERCVSRYTRDRINQSHLIMNRPFCQILSADTLLKHGRRRLS